MWTGLTYARDGFRQTAKTNGPMRDRLSLRKYDLGTNSCLKLNVTDQFVIVGGWQSAANACGRSLEARASRNTIFAVRTDS